MTFRTNTLPPATFPALSSKFQKQRRDRLHHHPKHHDLHKFHLQAGADAHASGQSFQPGGQAPQPTGTPPPPATGVWAKLKGFFQGQKFDRQRLAALGMGAFAAYGVVSNLNAGVLITIAWITVVRQTGGTPLDGNWPLFLGIYAGLWISSHFMRPIRLTLALAAAPYVDRLLDFLTKRLKIHKGAAFAVLLAGVVVVSMTFLFTLLLVFGGFPNGVGALKWK